MPFPNLSDPDCKTGSGRFIFLLSDGRRTVQIWPMESRGYYDVAIGEYDHADARNTVCYNGHTRSLEEATMVLSRWFVERCSIDSLHAQCVWIAREPLDISGPRMTFA